VDVSKTCVVKCTVNAELMDNSVEKNVNVRIVRIRKKHQRNKLNTELVYKY